jgi:hypothetical protein
MSTCASRLIRIVAVILGAAPAIAVAQPAPAGIVVPSVPPGLEVPAGHIVYLKGHAVGTQNYICLPSTSGVSWKFLGPQATVFDTFKGVDRQLTTHFLSSNAAENGLARPTWQHSLDSSRVWGRVVSSSTDPGYVESGAIAWLLLETAGTSPGSAGRAVLSRTTFIQRLNTSGGAPPSTGCGQASDAGTLALVPYTTDYFFYRSGNGPAY